MKALTFVLLGRDGLSPVVNQAGRNVQTSAGNMKKALGGAAVAWGALALAGAGASVKLAADFQTAMQKIVGLVGISQKQVNQWSDQILTLSTKLPEAPKDLAAAMYLIASAGFRGSQAMNVLTISARASAAGLGTTAQVTDAVTSAMMAYAKSGLTAQKVTDTITAAVTAGKMPVDSLAESIGQVLPVASQMGVKFSEVAAIAASLSHIGAPVERTMTGMRYLLSSMENPASATTKILAKFGITADDLRRSIADKGLLATLQMLHKTLPIQDFLKAVGGARGLVTALGLVGQNSGQVATIFKRVQNSAGDTNHAFEVASQTVNFKFKLALTSLESASIRLGAALLPILSKAVGLLDKLIIPLTQNKIAFVAMTLGVLGFAAVFKGLVTAVILGSISMKAALMTTGIGLALVAISIGITELALHWKTVMTALKTATSDTTGWILRTWHSVTNFFTGTWQTVSGSISKPFDTVSSTVSHYVSDVTGFFQKIISWVSSNFDQWWSKNGEAVKQVWNAVWGAMVAFVKFEMNVVKDVVTVGWQVLKNVFDIGMGFIKVAWDEGWGVMMIVYKGAWSIVKAIATTVIELLVNSFKAGFKVMTDIFKIALDTMAFVFKTVFDIIVGIFGIVMNILTGHWSTAWHDMENMFKQVMNNVWAYLQQVWHNIYALIVTTMGAIGKAISIVWNGIGSVFKAMWNNVLKPAFKLLLDTFLNIAGAIVNGAAHAFGWIPGIGGKLKDAARAFNQFRDNVNNSLNGVNNKTVKVNVNMGIPGISTGIPIGVRAPGFAGGGKITGPGTPTSDTAGLFALSRDEWVIQAGAAKQYGHRAMAAVNSGQAVIGYAGGGSPGLDIEALTPSAGAINSAVHGKVGKLAQQFAKTMGGSLAGALSLFMSFVGKVPYVWGGATPSGWDCSGAISWIYNKLGLHSGRDVASGLQSWGVPSGPTPGGMVFFGRPAHHVGMVINGRQMVSALGHQWGTTVSSLAGNSGYAVPPRAAGGGFSATPQRGGSVQALMQEAAAARGWTGAQWAALYNVEMREAGFNINARNPSSGAYGLAQFINGAGEYAQYGGTWLTAIGQIAGMLNYIAQRYGNPERAWAHEQAFHWYGGGTNGAAKGWAMVGERGPELVHFNGGEQVVPNHLIGYASGTGIVAAEIAKLRAAIAKYEYDERHAKTGVQRGVYAADIAYDRARMYALQHPAHRQVHPRHTSAAEISAGLSLLLRYGGGHGDLLSASKLRSDQTTYLKDIARYYTGGAARSRDKLVETQTSAMISAANTLAVIKKNFSTAQNYANSVKSNLSGFADLSNIDLSGGGGIVGGLAQRASQLKQFAAILPKLKAKGISTGIIQQIIAMGPETGLQYAQALLTTSTSGIKSINASEASIGSLTTSVGNAAAMTVYGINIAKGLASQEKSLNSLMNRLGNTLGREAAAWFKVPRGKIPRGYAGGTRGATRGWHVVGEDGPELLFFNGGESVIPNGSGLSRGRGTGTVIIENLNVNFRGQPLHTKAEIGRTVKEAIAYTERRGN